MLLLPTFCPTQPICGLCHGETATTPRIALSAGGVTGYDLGPVYYSYNSYLGNYIIAPPPPWDPLTAGGSAIPPYLLPIPVYDARNQIVTYFTGDTHTYVTETPGDDSSLTSFAGTDPLTPPPPGYHYPDLIEWVGSHWVGSVGSAVAGWIDPQKITLPANWWAWNPPNPISGRNYTVLHIYAKSGNINQQDEHGIGFGGSSSYSPQWDFGGQWVSSNTWYFYPDSENLPGHT